MADLIFKDKAPVTELGPRCVYWSMVRKAMKFLIKHEHTGAGNSWHIRLDWDIVDNFAVLGALRVYCPNSDEVMQTAALLHNRLILEVVQESRLRKQFGSEVSELVARLHPPKSSWEIKGQSSTARTRAYLQARLENCAGMRVEAQILSLAILLAEHRCPAVVYPSHSSRYRKFVGDMLEVIPRVAHPQLWDAVNQTRGAKK